MPRRAKKVEPDETLSLSVNGHTLHGESRGGVWSFTCSWPDLAQRHQGATSSAAAIGEFMARALAGAVKVKMVMAEMTRG